MLLISWDRILLPKTICGVDPPTIEACGDYARGMKSHCTAIVSTNPRVPRMKLHILPGLGTGLRQLSRMVKSRYRSAAKDDGTRTVEIAEYVSGEEVQVNRISIWYFDGISYIYAPH